MFNTFLYLFRTSSSVIKSVTLVGRGKGRMVRNYFSFWVLTFYNPLRSLSFLFCFTTFAFASEEQEINVDVEKLL